MFLVLTMFVSSCALKHKKKITKNESYEKTKASDVLKKQETESIHLLKKTDSNYSQQWLKIYPKGEINIQNGFIGQADSILWRIEGFQVGRSLHLKQDGTQLLTIEREGNEERVHKKENLVQKTKTSLLWWAVATIIIAVILFGYWLLKRIRL
ncbi:MAG: hypothetical protein EOP00_18820 [Pedobacter sp.]|nr:MAG: hypothetical protein EOP00_18820 [Pedobacter sp.]